MLLITSNDGAKVDDTVCRNVNGPRRMGLLVDSKGHSATNDTEGHHDRECATGMTGHDGKPQVNCRQGYECWTLASFSWRQK
jgi:hypothetical protein